MAEHRFFVYTRCNDLNSSRRFYTELIGLKQIWDDDESLGYLVGPAQLSVFLDPASTATPHWSFQPGWGYGLSVESRPPLAAASWSVELSPEAFRDAVDRLRTAGVTAWRREPFWVGYWSYVVRDPMGQTVELSDPLSSGPDC
ncbi:Catechol 2,3-dioxygenase [Tessaracoccus bendigoensis DSM 12906]|uniref:Catechol 2,3-dioxygenase n=1 Tax=Tessaracoccus bendigoensis DSM 12906 TaxID=1123357 RepID=A0A1M6JDL6_9ACTN|nr:VOC family protein [Tessaracoccus bendigoensis]SHJ44816.1 Catechol 2,3-dioxygenase [Tessaracoccus bendigoensis DSM 12906]